MLVAFLAVSHGLTLPTAQNAPALAAPTRRNVIAGSSAAVLSWAVGVSGAVAEEEEIVAPPPPPPPPPMPKEVTTQTGLKYTVLKSGARSASPVNGDLISIRFKCVIEKTGQVIDDILNNPEPYYYRVGSGQVLPAVEEAVVKMRAGDVWELTVPPKLGFGSEGRKASPGKPRISGDAVLKFTLALDGVPGKDDEIIEQNGIID